MLSIPDDRCYRATHQWAKLLPDGSYDVGITDFAQSELGDLMFVDCLAIGTSVKAGDSCATLESVKTASEVACPISGTIIAVNPSLKQRPEQLNESPYDHWILRIKPDSPLSDTNLLSASEYPQLL